MRFAVPTGVLTNINTMSKPRLTHRISRAALILVFALFSATTAWASVITLDENTGEVTLQNGDVLTGTGGINTNVKIADGATVTLSGVHITAYYNTNSNKRPGITCLGDAVIVMAEGTTNNVKGGNENPGIRVPADKTLTLQGSGTLNATGGWRAAGIGSGSESSCGTVIISAGTVTATGGGSGAGIGSGRKSSCGNITINGGIVNATGGNMGAGIGSGYAYSSCGTVTISGGIVNANGGEGAVGIGSGYSYSTCGNITITNNVIMVTATKGGYSPNTIGAGYGSSCGTVTIGGVTGSITQSPYTYIPNLVTLTPQSGEVTLQNGAVLTGTGGENTRVKIAAGATVVLFNVNITAIPDDNSHGWAGITCLGDAVIVLYQGTANDVKGGKFGSSIFVPQGHTLTLQGSGTLNATGGSFAAGIGSGLASTCGNIILSGGIINATGGSSCAGIGSGYWNASCESITITNGVTMVTATAGQDCDNAIGAGDVSSTCGTITIGGVETGFITESPFTTYPYTVSFDANGGSGTMANMGFMYGVAQNLTANSFTNWGHSFDGWTTSANGPKVYDDGQSVSNLAETSGATVTLYAKWITDISVSGDEYTIHTPTGWDDFCDLLANNSNGYFTGKTVKLDADISVTRMAGGSGHEFTGTFDGQGHTLTVSYQNNNGTVRTAPFSYVNGATIQNLVVAGDITGTASRAAGIVGETGNSLSHVTNCVSSVNISGGSYTGGISVGGNVEITGCVFNGTITGTNMSGGFVGYSNSVLVISDCLFAPQEGSSIVGGTFYYNGGGEITPVNSYYTEPLGTPQGIHAITFAAATPAGEAINTYSVSGLTTYANGMQYGDTFYINPDMNFSVDGDEYTIHTATGWEMFCDSLANNGNGFFTGKTVKLADNISVTRMAGGSDHEFTGTFDGQGHTLTVSYQNNNGTVRTAPFSYVNGATIQNLIVAGDITGTASRAAGIMGETGNSLSHVTNCVSSVNVSGGSYTGGISVGGKVEITGCVFNGTIVGTNMSGGFVGYSNSALVISDCLFAPQEGSSIVGGTFYYNGGGEITPVNSYYTVLLGTEQGHPAVSDPAILPAGDPTATYNVSGLTTYANGMLYGETFYYNPDMNFVLDIEGYGDASNPGGWYLIASPVVEAIAPSADNGFLTNEYDLYYFDQSTVGEEWRNYKDENYLITNGTGYLYASETATTLAFAGTPYTGEGEIELAYNPNVPDLAGWNLVGNPYAETAYVDRDCYVLNDERSEIIAAEGSAVEALEGIFVVADSAGETVTFSPTSKGTRHDERIVLNLTRDNGIVIDRAIVRFGKGKQLPKFQLDSNKTKLYISQDGKDYAIADATEMGEMPVNFKAEKNGTYTLTFSIETPGLDHLHLIDNLTDVDIDLLETPKYTFEAKTTDCVSRFRLVFATVK